MPYRNKQFWGTPILLSQKKGPRAMRASSGSGSHLKASPHPGLRAPEHWPTHPWEAAPAHPLPPEAWHRRRRRPHSQVTVHQPWVWGLFPVLEGHLVPSQPCQFRAVNLPQNRFHRLNSMPLSKTNAFWSGWAFCNSAKTRAFSHKPWRRRTSLKSYWRLPCVSFQQLPLRSIYAPFALFWLLFRSARAGCQTSVQEDRSTLRCSYLLMCKALSWLARIGHIQNLADWRVNPLIRAFSSCTA